MTLIQCFYAGNLHCRAKHLPSASIITTDAPPDHDGTGESFAPTDLLASALGTCILTVMGIHSRREGWDLGRAHALVRKTMSTELPRKIASLDVDVHLPPGLNAEQIVFLKQAAQDCPVMRSFSADLAIQLNWIVEA